MPADHGGPGPGAWPAPPPGAPATSAAPVRYVPPPVAPAPYPWLPAGSPGAAPGGPAGPGLPQLGAAHKPGAIPLRPLRLGDLYDGAFKIIRRNPGATVGSATLVTALTLAIPLVVAALLTGLFDLTLPSGLVEGSTVSGDSSGSDDPATAGEVAGLLVALGSLALSLVLQSVGIVLVTGMIAHVTLAAALGQRLTLGEAWAATHGRRWRLIGLASLLVAAVTVVLVLYGLSWVPVAMLGETVVVVLYLLVSVPVLLVLLVWLWVRVQYYSVPALMLEPVGILGALGRSWALSRCQFWRTLGIALLTAMITGVAGSMLSTPVSLVGQLLTFLADSPEMALLITLAVFAASSTIQYAFTTPFTSTVSSLQYLDQRMRKEAYDVELVARTGGLLP